MNRHDPFLDDSFAASSTDHGRSSPVAASDDATYEVFGLWMNVQLSQLVAKWERFAAPNARRTGGSFGPRFGKPRKAK